MPWFRPVELTDMIEQRHDRKAVPWDSPSLLLCDGTGRFDQASCGDEWIATSIGCFDKATQEQPDLIFVRFGVEGTGKRECLLELCAALKRNRHTRGCTVVAMLPGWHRALLERLRKASVDYVLRIGDTILDEPQLRVATASLGVSDRPDRLLEQLCPFLRDCAGGITVCGAYLDRMVLGGPRLRAVCHTENHCWCAYYLRPRCAS